MINWAKLIVGIIFVLSLVVNIFLWKKYSEDQVRFQMIKSSAPLQVLAEESMGFLSKQRKSLENNFKNNHYNIQNYGEDDPLVDVKALCDQKNGINCVYFKDGIRFYYGDHSEEI